LAARAVGPDRVLAGARRADAEDICQEVGARVLERSIAYRNADDLLAWCLRVGHNLLIDNARRTARTRRLGLVHDDVRNIEDDVVLTLRIRDVLSAISELSGTDRAALLGSESPTDRTTATRLAVRRHRARARLLKSIGGALAAAWATIRRLPRLTAASAATAAAVVALLTAQAPPAGEPADGAQTAAAPQMRTAEVVLALPAASAPAAGHARPAAKRQLPRQQAQPTLTKERPKRLVIKPHGAPQGAYVEERPRTEDDRLGLRPPCSVHR
jgi:hypothetical protein